MIDIRLVLDFISPGFQCRALAVNTWTLCCMLRPLRCNPDKSQRWTRCSSRRRSTARHSCDRWNSHSRRYSEKKNTHLDRCFNCTNDGWHGYKNHIKIVNYRLIIATNSNSSVQHMLYVYYQTKQSPFKLYWNYKNRHYLRPQCQRFRAAPYSVKMAGIFFS